MTTMSHAQNYHLADKKRQKRLEEIAKMPDGLANEVALARYMAESAAEQNNPAIVGQLVTAVGKLYRAETSIGIDRGKYIPRESVYDCLQAIVEAVNQARIKMQIADDSPVMDWLTEAIGRAVAIHIDKQKSPLQLEAQP
jgi:hypothetical protein